MQIKLIGNKRAVLVNIEGELDHHSATIIRETVDKELKRSNAVNVIFDFRDVSFMDSSGIGVIMGRYKIVKILNGSVIIFGANEHIKRIIEMSGIEKIVKVTTSFDNALLLL